MRDLLADPSTPPLERLRRFVRVFVRSECEEVELRHALGAAVPDYRDEPKEPRVAGTEAVEAFLLAMLPDVPAETRALAGEMFMMTLGQVGKAISERRFPLERADRYAEELADMLGGYLERLKREDRTPTPPR